MARSPSSRQRSGLRGVNRLRRTLRRVHQEADNRVKPAIEETSQRILADMQSFVPIDTGDLASLLDYRIARDGLTARIGLVTAKAQRDGFYARFIEYGAKPHGGHPGVPARPFMTPAFDTNQAWGTDRIQVAIREALDAASRGAKRGGND